jgi:hypothetical protein
LLNQLAGIFLPLVAEIQQARSWKVCWGIRPEHWRGLYVGTIPWCCFAVEVIDPAHEQYLLKIKRRVFVDDLEHLAACTRT